MIQVGDNFDHKSKKPLDNRVAYSTLAQMKAVVDANIYEGCEAYCAETDKYYKFKSTNTVDASTGKWREREGGSGGSYTAGGGIDIEGNEISTHNLEEGDMDDIIPNLPAPKVGASNLDDLSDIDLSNPTDGQVLKYNATTGKWENGAGGGTTINSLGDIADVNLSSLEDGQMIKWDNASGKWVNANIPEADTSKCYKTDDNAFTDLADADYVPVYDSSASTKKKSLWSNIKSVLKSYFDTVYDLNKNDIPMYGTSSTGASTTAKTASVSRGTFTLVAGAKVSIKFTNTNTASAPTLNVGSTGAKNIKYIDSDGTVTTPTTWWGAGEVVTFVYDGTQWLMMPTISMMPSLPVVGTINRSDIYDTTEKVIGKWTDGRPLYQKTFVGTSNSSGNITSVGTLSNARIYKIQGVISNTTTTMANSATSINIPVGATSTSGSGLDVSIFAYFDTSTINLTVADSANTYRNKGYAITVQYTKTTDSANSYNYANENDYSTSEKIVGTWIDGSYLYQKTIEVTLPTTTEGNWAYAYASLTNVSNVIEFKGSYKTSSVIVPIPWTSNSGTSCKVYYGIASSRIELATNNPTIGGNKAYITVTYTKA